MRVYTLDMIGFYASVRGTAYKWPINNNNNNNQTEMGYYSFDG